MRKVRIYLLWAASETFDGVGVAHSPDDEGLRLYRVWRRDQQGTLLYLRAAFQIGRWLGFSVGDGTGTPMNMAAFKPPT
jgi:hypothetical protein